jgi:hypothetical protein
MIDDLDGDPPGLGGCEGADATRLDDLIGNALVVELVVAPGLLERRVDDGGLR